MNIISMILLGTICMICMQANAWNSFTRRYGPTGHIPAIPLYFEKPQICKSVDSNCCKNAEEVCGQCENVEELQSQIAELKQSIRTLETSIAHRYGAKDSVTTEYHEEISD